MQERQRPLRRALFQWIEVPFATKVRCGPWSARESSQQNLLLLGALCFPTHFGHRSGRRRSARPLSTLPQGAITLLNCWPFTVTSTLKSMEDNFHNVVISMPVLRKHPFAPGKRRKLARHSQTRLLVTNDTILRKDTFANHHGIGRSGRATASRAIPGDSRGVENVHLEPAAVPKEIAGTKKRQDKESDNEPGRKQLCALSRAIRLAQELIMLLYEIRFLRSVVRRLVGHGFIEGVRLPAANSRASGREDTPQAAWHPRWVQPHIQAAAHADP